MPKLSLNDRSVRSLKTKKPSEEFWDTSYSVGSFGIRVFKSGRKDFMLRYYDKQATKRRYMIGTYPALGLAQARVKATEFYAMLGKGEDPSLHRDSYKKSLRVKDLVDMYMNNHCIPNLKPKSILSINQILKKDIIPELGDFKVKDVSRRVILDLVDRVKKRGGYQANRTQSLIHSILKYALNRDLIPFNPASGLNRPFKEKSKTRYLSKEEIIQLWETLETESVLISGFFRLLLLTGQRCSELKSLRWTDIKDDIWTIQPEFTKNKTEHKVYLNQMAKDVLKELMDYANSSKVVSIYVFPSQRKVNSSINWITKASHRITKNFEVKFTPHDLRRTCATLMASLGVHRDVIAKILNHADTGNRVTMIYDRANREDEVKLALNQLSLYLNNTLQISFCIRITK